MTTTPTDDWVWTRDYSTCNRRRLEEETFANTKKGVRGAPRRRAQQEDNENADDVAVLVVHVLAWAVDIVRAEDHIIHSKTLTN